MFILAVPCLSPSVSLRPHLSPFVFFFPCLFSSFIFGLLTSLTLLVCPIPSMAVLFYPWISLSVLFPSSSFLFRPLPLYFTLFRPLSFSSSIPFHHLPSFFALFHSLLSQLSSFLFLPRAVVWPGKNHKYLRKRKLNNEFQCFLFFNILLPEIHSDIKMLDILSIVICIKCLDKTNTVKSRAVARLG